VSGLSLNTRKIILQDMNEIISKSYKALMKLRGETRNINEEVAGYYKAVKSLYLLERLFEMYNKDENINKIQSRAIKISRTLSA